MMASHPKAPAKVLCKYFMSNCCTKGQYCPFSHDWKHKPDMRCKYYMMGTCNNGKNCRYDHTKPEGWEPEEKTSRSSLPEWNTKPQGNVPLAPINLPSISSSSQSSASSASLHSNSATQRKMVTLRDDPSRNPKKWVQAAEFVPGKLFHGAPENAAAMSTEPVDTGFYKGAGIGGAMSSGKGTVSYSGVLGLGLDKFMDTISADDAATLLCPFAEMGHCPFEMCEYLHGNVCDMCNRECLNPFDEQQRKNHQRDCLAMHEREMERAFQAQESEGKQCAICMEYVVSKQPKNERRFGILQNCDHIFCLSCIRKWRSSTHTGKRTIRACPLCRTVSYFIIPSSVWIDDLDQKEKLKQEYRDNLGKKHCKYFNKGEDVCPFGDSCFYKHELADGTKVQQELRMYETAEGEKKVSKRTTLWDYLNTREEYAHLNPHGAENWEEGEDTSGASVSHNTPTGVQDESSRSTTETSHGNRNMFWLNYECDADIDDMNFMHYEPDVGDMDFL